MNKKNNLENKKIIEDILNLKKQILNLNFQKSSGQLEKTSQIKNAKKNIARLKTKLSKTNGVKNA
jgi:large subunit ribosomal protein L29